MGHCETCGNEYDKTLEVVKDGATHTFDSFRMRHSSALPTMRLPYHRARRGG
jgi:hypothetical protein